ncbi:MAG TPA: hypothetical protein PKK74_05080 [Candidatus Methanoculleus thermohydrogenotrophicum]|mgnify:CR=1 FL=1|jgi:hypothetical protein|nr:hypothetical protein [Candidatus Methanoculleus thermohydrogenotrophicum]NLM82790.1 hypothetical protein [Candidatus Methanoculleus thermohydrogenotrophicum]HOB18050.1 hypothetical protein [Candidatus Methanoculleus thermohydrogenotrophicum]HPZ38123.1 hypothetical protein [Candidatus Methanoculleus thermohydrogenotrophicum]HQC90996.1 hypothetical protein [Candidatus Methanoculleus thermohydrogenotrophicum]
MTRLRYLSSICAVCGETCRFSIPEAVVSIGSRDLDTRPAEPLRSTIYAWVKRCPSCGYCAPNPGKAQEGAAEVVKLPRYREQLDSRKFPRVANTFLCWSIIQEDLGAQAQAAWASLHAAWACDDEGDDVPARICRKRAVNLMRRAWEQGERLAPQAGADEALLVDLLRRAGRFREARAVAKEVIEQNPHPLITEIMRFQIRLVAASDRGAHTVAEARRSRQAASL